jgi:hypothetical protein
VSTEGGYIADLQEDVLLAITKMRDDLEMSVLLRSQFCNKPPARGDCGCILAPGHSGGCVFGRIHEDSDEPICSEAAEAEGNSTTPKGGASVSIKDDELNLHNRLEGIVVDMYKLRNDLDLLRVYTSNFCTTAADAGSLARGNRCTLAKGHEGACVFGQLQPPEPGESLAALKAENEALRQKLCSIVMFVHTCDGNCTQQGCSAFKNPESAVRQTVVDLKKLLYDERKKNGEHRRALASSLGIGPTFQDRADWKSLLQDVQDNCGRMRAAEAKPAEDDISRDELKTLRELNSEAKEVIKEQGAVLETAQKQRDKYRERAKRLDDLVSHIRETLDRSEA